MNGFILMLALLTVTPSCAAVLRALPTVIQYVQDAQMILDMLDAQAQPLLKQFAGEEVKKEYSRAMVVARQSLQVALRSTKGADELSKSQTEEAFRDFRIAYTNLEAILRRAGVMGVDGAMKASPGAPSIEVPKPMALTGG